jgi:hypothetical protein
MVVQDYPDEDSEGEEVRVGRMKYRRDGVSGILSQRCHILPLIPLLYGIIIELEILLNRPALYPAQEGKHEGPGLQR